MRSFIIAIVLFVCMLAGGIFLVHYIENVSENMITKNDEIMVCIEKNDFEKALVLVGELKGYVDEKRGIISSTMDHGYADTIEIYICELEKYIESEGKADSLAKSEVLDMLFKYLPKNYRLKWENVF